MAEEIVLAVDLGAESGRVMGVHFDGRHLRTEEHHRFPNQTVFLNNTLHWNFLRLWEDIRGGIEKAKPLGPASLGVDTWGVDFGLLDRQGTLIGNPVHYRDKRTDGMPEKAFAKVGRQAIFENTGIQFMQINTLYQLLSLVESQSPLLSIAETFLTAPDLLNYWLTGAKVCEFTNATTTQMLNARTGKWATGLLADLDIPTHIFPEVVMPGTRIGAYEGIPVIAPACHDTGSAVAAVPATSPDFAYISSGTWSLVGLEVQEAIVSEAALAANVTNEGGIAGTYRLLKNVMGLWILQQCRKTWADAGNSYSYADLVEMAEAAPALRSVFDANDPRFLPPGNHVQHIQNYCRESKQPVLESPGEITRCILESLALAYREVLSVLTGLQGKVVSAIHIVGGGSQNTLLNQMTADATGLPVIAGPTEATVIGNALVQLISLGAIGNIPEGRALVAQLPEIRTFRPADKGRWDAAYARVKELSR